MLKINVKLLCATALSLAFISSVDFPPNLGIYSNQANAKSSGGRSGGGSFSRPSSSFSRSSQPASRPSSSSSKPASHPTSTNRPTRTTPYNPSYSNSPRRQTVVVPVPVAPQQPYYQSPNNPPANQTQSNPNSTSNSQSQSQSSSNTSDSDDPIYFWIGLIFLLVMLGVIVGVPSLIIFLLLKNRKNAKPPTNELENDIVTVSKRQVALLSNVKGLQSELSDLSLHANTETPE